MVGPPVVLVVEDEWIVRDSIAEHLRAARFRTLEARTGEAAVSLLEGGERVDVVFTDIQLGGRVDGWEVGVRFRSLLPRIPIIYTSGEDLQPKLAVPRSLFFVKPYEPRAIVDACRVLIGTGLCSPAVFASSSD
jgi:CheY-like chemotaxis protein